MNRAIATVFLVCTILIMTACATGGGSTEGTVPLDQAVQDAPAVEQPTPAPTPSPTPVVIPVPDGLDYEVVDGRSVTITKYTGSAVTLEIPAQIQGLPVTSIGERAFRNCSSLTSVTLSQRTHVGLLPFPSSARINYRD